MTSFQRLSNSLSIMPGFRYDQVVFWRRGQPVSHNQFVNQCLALSQQLPPAPCFVNLCEDRYLFVLSLCASLLRGATSLFPPNRLANTINDIAVDYPGTLCLSDAPVEGLNVPLRQVSEPAADLSEPVEVPAVVRDEHAVIVFTSGSTGKPQPHRKRWSDLMLGARLAAKRFGIDASATLVTTVPAQHMYGLELSVALPLAIGAAADNGRPFFPEDVRSALERCPPPRILVTTPFHLSSCVESNIDWPQIEFVISATAPLSPELAERAERKMRTRVFEIYGCTEAGSLASRRTCDGPSWRWYDGVAVRAGGGPVSIDAEFLPTPVTLADVLEFDEGGGFRLFGRNSDMIKIAGKRASLADLNIKLNGIDGVADGVFVVPEEKEGVVQRLAAVVVAPTLGRETLLVRLRKLIDSAFLPRRILFVERLPRNHAGKLPRRVLMEMLGSDAGTPRA